MLFLYNITFLEESGEIEDIQENPLNPSQDIRTKDRLRVEDSKMAATSVNLNPSQDIRNKDRLRFEDSKMAVANMAATNVYPDISMFPDSIFKDRRNKVQKPGVEFPKSRADSTLFDSKVEHSPTLEEEYASNSEEYDEYDLYSQLELEAGDLDAALQRAGGDMDAALKDILPNIDLSQIDLFLEGEATPGAEEKEAGAELGEAALEAEEGGKETNEPTPSHGHHVNHK